MIIQRPVWHPCCLSNPDQIKNHPMNYEVSERGWEALVLLTEDPNWGRLVDELVSSMDQKKYLKYRDEPPETQDEICEVWEWIFERPSRDWEQLKVKLMSKYVSPGWRFMMQFSGGSLEFLELQLDYLMEEVKLREKLQQQFLKSMEQKEQKENGGHRVDESPDQLDELWTAKREES